MRLAIPCFLLIPAAAAACALAVACSSSEGSSEPVEPRANPGAPVDAGARPDAYVPPEDSGAVTPATDDSGTSTSTPPTSDSGCGPSTCGAADASTTAMRDAATAPHDAGAPDANPFEFDASAYMFDAGSFEFDASAYMIDAGPFSFDASAFMFDAGPLEFDAAAFGFDAAPFPVDAGGFQFDAAALGITPRSFELDAGFTIPTSLDASISSPLTQQAAPHQFACGTAQCNSPSQYCIGQATTAQCVNLPSNCTGSPCSCLNLNIGGKKYACDQNPFGEIRVTPPR